MANISRIRMNFNKIWPNLAVRLSASPLTRSERCSSCSNVAPKRLSQRPLRQSNLQHFVAASAADPEECFRNSCRVRIEKKRHHRPITRLGLPRPHSMHSGTQTLQKAWMPSPPRCTRRAAGAWRTRFACNMVGGGLPWRSASGVSEAHTMAEIDLGP